ncbi:MAG: glycosyltransferase [Coriobacteriia bacterium]
MSKTPRVLQVNTADIRGGAENVALGLHRAYLARGVDAHLAVGHKQGDAPGVIGIPNEASRSSWARSLGDLSNRTAGGPHPRGLRRGVSRALLLTADLPRYTAIAAGLEDFDYPATTGLLDLAGPRPGVLHLHNLHGYYFNLRALPRLSTSQPTILTMHDPWPLAGHCAHPIDCPRCRTGCGDGPDLGRYVPIRRDASARNFEIKRTALGASMLSYATPSQWLMDMAVDSGVVSETGDARVIPNGIDLATFSPGDRSAARKAVGLPQNAHVIVISGRGLRTNPFKDFATLVEAIKIAGQNHHERPLVLVALGADGVSESFPGGALVIPVAFTDDTATVASYYRAADLYVHAARAENLPLAVIEAMACGTAVVATRVGGVPEIVLHKETGLLAEPGDSHELAVAIEALLADDARRRAYGEAGAARARARFALERQAEAYLEWYRELTSRH